MASGIINAVPYVALSGLSPATTNRAAQMFILGPEPLKDVGYITSDVHVVVYLWNGTTSEATLTSVSGDSGAEGTTWDATPPDVVDALRSLRVIMTVSAVVGPLEFTGLLTFASSCNTVLLTITGTRAPQLSGDVGYLLFGHNWIDGLDEHMAWKTDVMIAHDRTEQRVQLRTLPRRSWDVRFLVADAARRKFETWFGMRKTRYFFMPIWRDMVKLTSPISAGDSTIAIADHTDNLVAGTHVAIWGEWDQREVRTITGVGTTFVTVDAPFLRDWPAGVAMAPGRYCVSLDTRQVNRFTGDVGDYRLTVLAMNDGWEPDSSVQVELYRSLPVCPFTPKWSDGEESFDSKWVQLDNDTGVIEFDLHSKEPVMSREAKFLIIGRDNIYAWLAFLKARAGRITPFWLASNDRGFELSAPAVTGDAYIVLEPIDYDYALKGSPARTHIEMITTDGTVIRRMITGVETMPSGDEKLTLDSALPVDIDAANLNRCSWLELCRFNSDNLTVHWVTMDCIEATVPIMVLP